MQDTLQQYQAQVSPRYMGNYVFWFALFLFSTDACPDLCVELPHTAVFSQITAFSRSLAPFKTIFKLD